MASHETSSQSTHTADDSLPNAAARAAVAREYPLRVGRYELRVQIGAGTSGKVFVAFDPTLQRTVALKLLRVAQPSKASRQQFVNEARIMARLSHTNVVAVHEVSDDEPPFLSMDYVESLASHVWLAKQPRSVAEILDVVVQAGRGLQAAHKAGVVHCDFKPANVLVTHDGHAKVIDFGLARMSAEEPEVPGEADDRKDSELSTIQELVAQRTRRGGLIGTPAYMAPEQFARGAMSHQTDQFNFCASLWEALNGERAFAGVTTEEMGRNVRAYAVREPRAARKVPPWIVAILRRGLSVRPEDRFPSMSALLQALEQGRVQIRTKRVLLGLGALGFVAAAFLGWRQYERREQVHACEAAGKVIDAVWNDDVRARTREKFMATGVPHAGTSFELVRPLVDQFVDAWRTGRREACLAGTVDRTLAPVAHSRAILCFNESIAQFRMIVQLGLSNPVRQVPENAVHFVSRLPAPERCLDEAALARQVSLPAAPDALQEVVLLGEQAHFLDLMAIARRFPEAQALGRHIIARANVLGYQTLRARVLMSFAQMDLSQGLVYLARDRFVEAYFVAVRAGADYLAAEIASALVFVLADELHDSDAALLWGALGEAALDRFGADDLLRIYLLNHIGLAHFAARDYERARTFHTHALDLAEQHLGSGNPAIAMMLNNLANVFTELHDFDSALDYYYAALDHRVRAQGPEHAEVGKLLSNLTEVLRRAGRYEEAIEVGEEALAHRRRGLGTTHPSVGKTLYNLGRAYASVGENARAMDAFRQALDILESTYGPNSLDGLTAKWGLARALLDIGAYDEAKQHFAWVRARSEILPDPPYELIMSALVGEAKATIALGLNQDAVRTLERALAIEGQVSQELTVAAQFLLAQLLWATKSEQPRAARLASDAREACRSGDSSPCTMLDDMESWLELRG